MSGSDVRMLRVFPDYFADPVWTVGHGMVDLDGLAVSPRLRLALRAWARAWEALMGMAEARYAVVDEPAYAVWRARGAELARSLQAELGATAVVRYEA